MIVAVIFGPPGSGKGTQAEHLSRVFGVLHVSTGDMLRAEVVRGSDLGREVQPIMEAGELVPDDLIVRALEERLHHEDARHGVLLDGFPRTVPQAGALDHMLHRTGRRVDVVLCLVVPEDVVTQRILYRGEMEGRSDDTPEAIHRRLEEYEAKTAPVLDYYRSQGVRLESVDGTGSVEEVRQRVHALVEPLISSRPA